MPRKPRTEMIEETKAKLLKTARHYFSTVGYANTVMDNLTAEAGLTRGALYHHFGDKRGLFSAVLQQIDAEIDHKLNQLSTDHKDAWSILKARCYAYLELVTAKDIERILLRDANSVLPFEHLQKIKINCISSLSHLLSILIDNEEIEQVDPTLLAKMLNGALTEAALDIIADQNNPDKRQELAKEALDTLMNGLRKSKKT